MKRVLIIGAGGIGKRHIRGFLKTGRARVSICEPDEGRRSDVIETYDIERSYASADDAPLADFDLAVVSAPAHLHVAAGMSLVRAGVPFLVEKPLSVSMDGVDELVAAVADSGLPARVGYTRRARPWVVTLREQILGGRIGALRMAIATSCQDYRKYRPDYADIYYARKAMGGGAILDGATHLVDMLLWIMGSVSEVASMYDRLEFGEECECEDTALISLRFKSGAMAQITMNQFQKPNVADLEFIGTLGNLRLVGTRGEIHFADDDSGNWHVESHAPAGKTAMELHEANFEFQANQFMDIVQGKPGCLTTLEEARENLAVCLAAKLSYETRRMVEL